jgi:mRNA interferase MazF
MEITKELIKIFADWTKLKIRIHVADNLAYPKKKEVWWVSLGQNVGVEANGKNNQFERPAVVLKVFNNQGFLVAPTSSKVKDGPYFIASPDIGGQKGIINLSQIRSISVKRFIRKIGELNDDDFNKIREILNKDFI